MKRWGLDIFVCVTLCIGLVHLQCPQDPPPSLWVLNVELQNLKVMKLRFQRCFNQSDFDLIINTKRQELQDNQTLLLRNVDYPGFLLTPSEAANHHFSSTDISDEDFDNHLMSLYVNEALIWLKNSFNLTTSQLQFCLKGISTAAFCTPRVSRLDPLRTK